MTHLRIAVQMDPIEAIDIRGDSTFALMLEAQARGHALWHYEVKSLAWRPGAASGGRVTAWARPVTVRDEVGAHVQAGPAERLDLASMDVVLMRQDPPFDMGYITATYVLEAIQPGTLVVNDPAAVRNAPEKLLVTNFPDLMPPTLITWDAASVRAFREEHGDIVLKPLYGNGGAGVFRVRRDDENLASLLEVFARTREPVMAQRYEKAVRTGDKRIILVDGEPMGAINRVPAEGEARSNMHVGGRAEAAVLTEREREICAAIGPTLRERVLLFAGIDVIGDFLTEINVTSPTGLREVARFDGARLERAIWDRIEARLGA